MCIFDTRVTLAHAGNSMSFYSIKLFVDEERSRPVGRVYMHLTYDQRLAIKQMLERGNSKKEIAESIGVHTSTIYREIDFKSKVKS